MVAMLQFDLIKGNSSKTVTSEGISPLFRQNKGSLFLPYVNPSLGLDARSLREGEREEERKKDPSLVLGFIEKRRVSNYKYPYSRGSPLKERGETPIWILTSIIF